MLPARTLLAALALALSGNCASLAPPVQLHGSARDLERLTGEWRGEYTGNADHATRGTIVFTLVAGGDHAHGDVLMTPYGFESAYERYRGGDPAASRRGTGHASSVLTIRFVTVEEDTVRGVLDPYWDPDRFTEASTTFRGRVKDDVIEGTFTTRYGTGAADTNGRWKVVRARAR